MLKEKSLKQLIKSIGNTNDILKLDCSIIYSQLKDERFTFLSKKYYDVNYEEILTNFCNSIPSLKYQN